MVRLAYSRSNKSAEGRIESGKEETHPSVLVFPRTDNDRHECAVDSAGAPLADHARNPRHGALGVLRVVLHDDDRNRLLNGLQVHRSKQQKRRRRQEYLRLPRQDDLSGGLVHPLSLGGQRYCGVLPHGPVESVFHECLLGTDSHWLLRRCR